MRKRTQYSFLAILLALSAVKASAIESFEFRSKNVRAKILLKSQETEFHLNDSFKKFKHSKNTLCTEHLNRLKDDLANKILMKLMNSKAFSHEKKDGLSFLKIDGQTFYSLNKTNDTQIAYHLDELYKISISASIECKK